MKRKTRSIARALAGATVAVLAITSVPSHAKDPCKMFICMAGKLKGETGGDDCAGPISDYFDIISFRHGHIDFSATAKNRSNSLNSCPGVETGLVKSIVGAFSGAG